MTKNQKLALSGAVLGLVFSSGVSWAGYVAKPVLPVGALETFVTAGDNGTAVGWASYPIEVPGIPDARSVQAFTLNVSSGAFVDLDPGDGVTPGIFDTSASYAYGAGGGKQVGTIFASLSGGQAEDLAVMWSGSAASIVMLKTEGTTRSVAFATDGVWQGGSAATLDRPQSAPFVWQGTAASGTLLNVPAELDGPDYGGSVAGVSGGRFVGTVFDNDLGMAAAMYWSSASAAARVIRPTGFDETFGQAIDGGTLLLEGYGQATDGPRHVFLYDVETETFTDLHPAGAINSYGKALRDGIQGGVISLPDPNTPGEQIFHAGVWFGTAASFIDLHGTLPADAISSEVVGIDGQGNLYGNYRTAGGYFGVQWVIPEPGGLGWLVLAGVMLRRRR